MPFRDNRTCPHYALVNFGGMDPGGRRRTTVMLVESYAEDTFRAYLMGPDGLGEYTIKRTKHANPYKLKDMVYVFETTPDGRDVRRAKQWVRSLHRSASKNLA